MTRRNEDSGLIDLDALMREAAAREAPREREREVPRDLVSRDLIAPRNVIFISERAAQAHTLQPLTPPAPPTIRPPAQVIREESRKAQHVPPATPEKIDRYVTSVRKNGDRGRVAGRAAKIGAAIGVAIAIAILTTSVVVRHRHAAVVAALPSPTGAAAIRTPSSDGHHANNSNGNGSPSVRADDLPVVTPPPPSPSSSAAPLAHSKTQQKQANDEAAPAAAPQAATLTESDLANPGSGSAAGDLGDAMRSAAGTRGASNANASPNGPSGPAAAQVRPSPGAVVGALGSVLPAARACLGPDDPIRNGLVVFRSDGTVERVEMRGGAGGGEKPTDECVRSALSKAKVAPFVDETFATRVTVRP